MNWDQIEGNWKQLKGSAKEQWGKLTDDQLDVIAGQRDQMAGKIQEVYGISKYEAEKQVADWQSRALVKMRAVGKDSEDSPVARSSRPSAH